MAFLLCVRCEHGFLNVDSEKSTDSLRGASVVGFSENDSQPLQIRKQVEMKFRKKRYTQDEQLEIDAAIAKLKATIRKQFTWRYIINPGWKQWVLRIAIFAIVNVRHVMNRTHARLANERGDVPGWVLVVLMTTGLVTAIWTLAAPRIQSILRTSLDSMNNIR